jgi:hypothetical protein
LLHRPDHHAAGASLSTAHMPIATRPACARLLDWLSPRLWDHSTGRHGRGRCTHDTDGGGDGCLGGAGTACACEQSHMAGRFCCLGRASRHPRSDQFGRVRCGTKETCCARPQCCTAHATDCARLPRWGNTLLPLPPSFPYARTEGGSHRAKGVPQQCVPCRHTTQQQHHHTTTQGFLRCCKMWDLHLPDMPWAHWHIQPPTTQPQPPHSQLRKHLQLLTPRQRADVDTDQRGVTPSFTKGTCHHASVKGHGTMVWVAGEQDHASHCCCCCGCWHSSMCVLLFSCSVKSSCSSAV